MIDIDISGKSKNINKKKLRKAILWASKYLNIDNYRDPIYIDCHLDDLGDCHGQCGTEDFRVRAREFYVELNNTLSYDDMLIAIFHEMVHVAQYAKGHLQHRTFAVARWKEYYIPWEKYSYRSLPWEVEAYKMEEIMYNKYMKEKMNDY